MAQQVTILIPVYNDAESLNVLLAKLAGICREQADTRFEILVVDDGSSSEPAINSLPGISIHVLHLQRNIGHQKAIAVGLAYCKENITADKILVMDGDGEDRPEDIPVLLQASGAEPGKIIFAQRKTRQEGRRFRFFYWLYKLAFRLLTGRKISFGNFMVIPKPLLEKAVYYSEIWNHIAGGILKTNLPYSAVPLDRGHRYAGVSKMNFLSLLMHGLGAIAVFIEVIASRLLIFSLLLIGISLLAILALAAIKAFTDRAIPGWTSTVSAAMLIILLQSFLLSLFTIFLYLSFQSQRKFIPAQHYRDYTGRVETLV